MIVPDQIRKCVAFIGYRKQDGIPHLVGTAFFVARPVREDANPIAGSIHTSFAYLLTAKHVLDKLRNKGLNEVLVRFNYLDWSVRAKLQSIAISLTNFPADQTNNGRSNSLLGPEVPDNPVHLPSYVCPNIID